MQKSELYRISREEWKQRYLRVKGQLEHYKRRVRELEHILEHGYDNPSEIEFYQLEITRLTAENNSLRRKLRKKENLD